MPRFEVGLFASGFHVPMRDFEVSTALQEDLRDIRHPGAAIVALLTSRRVGARNADEALIAAKNRLCSESRVVEFIKISLQNGCEPVIEAQQPRRISMFERLFSRCDQRMMWSDNSENL